MQPKSGDFDVAARISRVSHVSQVCGQQHPSAAFENREGWGSQLRVAQARIKGGPSP